ncbi:MAG: AmmeMemoRadiSam system radical SAM enzyme [Campylobacterales bacterium]|nr:AmmeMemoRadiSam system radical SAM enzyme [Campylobacterales bacterium]
MQFYTQSSLEKIKCELCGHLCNLKPDQMGICGVNKNTGSKIECLVYGYPNAIHVDPIEKKPLYHFLPKTKTFSIGTVGCNFRCSFCQNWQLSQTSTINKQHYYKPEDIVKLALHYDCKSISYTYNEPTIFYPYIFDIASKAHKNGLKNIMVTNGFQSHKVRESMIGLIDAINVDLKSFDPKYYKKNLGGKLEVILDNLKFFASKPIHMELTTLIVPTHNDSNEMIEQIASFVANELGVHIPWHLSAFHPAYKEQKIKRTPIETLLKAKSIANKYKIQNIHLGNVGIIQ